MNQLLESNSGGLKNLSKSTNELMNKIMPPLTTKTDKYIKFFKEEKISGALNEEQFIKPKDLSIDLAKVIESDAPYGKCQQNETLDCANNKKKQMLQDDYFSSTVDKNQLIDMKKLPEYFNIKEEDVKFQVDSIFETALLDIKKVDEIKKNINEFQLTKSKGRIGPLRSCESLTVLINVNNKAIKQSFDEMKSEIKMTRYILNDGNSFFRAFMLGLFEHNILYSKIDEIRKLIWGICTKIKGKQLHRHNPSIRLHEVMIILYLIYSEVVANKTKSAYELLLKSLNQSKSFDYSLIKFMRIALAEYIETNADVIFKSEAWEEIEQIAAPAYLSNHYFDYKNYINDRVLAMHYEADKFIIQIAPVVFRINLDLYAIEGTANEVRHLAYIKNHYHYIDDASSLTSMSLFYSFSRYHKLYSTDYMKYHNVNITFRSHKAPCQNYRFHIISSNKICETCNETSDVICFNHIPRMNFCKQCLISSIDRTIIKRITHFTEEYYNNKEYYFRFLSLSDNFEDTLYEEDFIALFSRNIPQQILYTMERSCFQCLKVIENEFEIMPCKCKICHECIIDNILEATDQKIVLNQYEKSNPKLKKVNCACQNTFDVEKAIDLMYQSKLSELSKEAQLRLLKSVEVTCSFCGMYHEKGNYSKTVSLNTNIVKKDYLDVIRFSIMKDKNPHIVNCNHIICKKCIKDLKHEIKSKIQRGEIKDKDHHYPLNCKVCLHPHQFEEKLLKHHKYGNCCLIY